MAVSETWTDPDSLDRATGDVLTEVIWDGVVSNLAYLGGQTATGVVAPQRQGLVVDNSTGGSLAAGTLVYVSGYDASTGAPQITKADADSRQAEYILSAAIANGASGVVYRGYTLGSLDTSGSSVGDPIYLSATAGSWSATALTGAAQISQKVGGVVTSHASTGSILFLLPGEMLKIGSGHIQAKSIGLSALADGTDGELITWSAAGVAAAVPTGTSTHVLTSNGAGAAPTFQAASGGGFTQKFVNVAYFGMTGNGSSGGAIANNDAFYMPIDVMGDMTITKISLYIQTSSGNIDVGLYNSSGTKLVSSGSTSRPGTGVRTITVASTDISAGQHYLAIAADNTTFKWGQTTGADTMATRMMQRETSDFPLPSSFTVGAWPTALSSAVGPPAMTLS